MLVALAVPGITINTQVFARHTVYKAAVKVIVERNYSAAHLQVSVWIERIHDRERHARVAQQVTIFLLALGLAEADIRAIPAKPNRCGLWLAVRPNSCDMRQRRAHQQIMIFFRNQAIAPFIAVEQRSIASMRARALYD